MTDDLITLKKRRTKLHIMQYALGDYPQSEEVKGKINSDLMDELIEINKKIEALETVGGTRV